VWATRPGLAIPVLALVGFLLVACAGGPTAANAPEGNATTIEIGQTKPYRLHTHCGVTYARINGTIFYADPPLTHGSGNPPVGWGDPFTDGEMTVRDSSTADFRDAADHRAHFTSRPRGPTPSVLACF
jgi:hypothetical protein